MVWGGVCLRGRTELHVMAAGTLTAVRYRDEILDPIVRPFAGAIGNNFILMQDNARPHTARLTMDYLYHDIGTVARLKSYKKCVGLPQQTDIQM